MSDTHTHIQIMALLKRYNALGYRIPAQYDDIQCIPYSSAHKLTLSPIKGTLVYDSDLDQVQTFTGAAWMSIGQNVTTFSDPVDPSKMMRLDLSGISPLTVRTLTMPDQNVDLTQMAVVTPAQWAYVQGMDQAISTTSSPKFLALGLESGAFKVSLSAPAGMGADFNFVLPSTGGTNHQFLQWNTAGGGASEWSSVVDAATFRLSNYGAPAAKLLGFNTTAITPGTTRNLIVPDYDVGLAWAGLMDQSVSTTSSPTFLLPLLKTGVELEDPGIGTNTLTLQAATGTALYSLSFPAADGAASKFLQYSSTPGLMQWGTDLLDTQFHINNNTDPTRQIAFNAAGVGAGNVRTITMPNYDVNLQYAGLMDQSVSKTSSPEFLSPLIKTSLVLEDPGAGTNTATLQAGAVGTSYALTLPLNQGAADEFLQLVSPGVLQFGTNLKDSTFNVFANGAPTNKLRFDAQFITGGNTRTVTMADYGVDLRWLNQDVKTTSSPTFASPIVGTSLRLQDPVGTNKLTIQAANATTAYSLTMPSALQASGSTGALFTTDSGAASWSAWPTDSEQSGFVAWSGGGPYWSYNSTSHVFTLLQAGYGYVKGKRVDFAASQTATCTINAGNFLAIDATGTLNAVSFSSTFYRDNIALFELYDDGTAGTLNSGYLVKKENHSVNFPINIMQYFHRCLGNIIESSGAVLSASATANTLSITGDSVSDHGLITAIPAVASPSSITIQWWYYDTALSKWRRDSTATTTPGKYWNKTTGALITDTTNNHRLVYKLYVTQDCLNDSNPVFMGVINSLDTTTGNTGFFTSVANANTAINGGLITTVTSPFTSMEWCQLGYVVTNYTGGAQTVVRVTVQKNTFGQIYTGGSGAASHLTLGDLSGGQYGDGGHTNLATVKDANAVLPTVNDDTSGYKIGSMWVYQPGTAANNVVYVNVDNTATQALWKRIAWAEPTTNYTNNNYVMGLGSGANLNNGAGLAQYNTIVGYGIATNANSTHIYSNTALGYQALMNVSRTVAHGSAPLLQGEFNTAIGSTSATSLTTGHSNVTVGDAAGTTLTTGTGCVLIGRGADSIAAGDHDVGVGSFAVATGGTTVAIGGASSTSFSARATTQGSVVVGSAAAATSGTFACAYGYGTNALGASSVAIGAGSNGSALASGASSISIGGSASTSTVSAGAHSVAIGTGARAEVETVAIGKNALTLCTAGSGINVAIGSGAGAAMTSGGYNVFIGNGAAAAATSGTSNVALGINSVIASAVNEQIAVGNGATTTAKDGIAIGRSTSAAAVSVALGTWALASGTNAVAIGAGNSADGSAANSANATGGQSIAMGYNSLASATFGIAIGPGTTGSGQSGIAIGTTCTASGTGVAMGVEQNNNVSGKFLYGTATGTYVYLTAGSTSVNSSSDERMKQNMRPLAYGLSLIDAVVPIHYEMIETPSQKQIGFGAQTTKAAMDVLGITMDDFPGIKLENDGFYSMSPSTFVPVLVKAVQELSAQNKTLIARLDALEARVI